MGAFSPCLLVWKSPAAKKTEREKGGGGGGGLLHYVPTLTLPQYCRYVYCLLLCSGAVRVPLHYVKLYFRFLFQFFLMF